MSLSSPYQDPALCRTLLDRLQTALDGSELRFMEVCGTHTVSIFQSGLRPAAQGSHAPVRAGLPRLRHPRRRSGRLPRSGRS